MEKYSSMPSLSKCGKKLHPTPDVILTERQKRIIGNHTLTPQSLGTGFGIHSWSSLRKAIDAAKTPEHICKCIDCDGSPEEEMNASLSRSESSQTTSLSTTSSILDAKQKLNYIMGLSSAEEEDDEKEKLRELNKMRDSIGEEAGDLSEAMRNAQNYLREHRIFEFFQYLVANLLAEAPFDPIEFLLNLLDKCLIYRSGVGNPPLLYTKKHLNCLFDLMDRMRTGFITYDQYKTGMHTLGIKCYNKTPPLSKDGLVPKNYFIDEGYERLKDLLNDILRKRTKVVRGTIKKFPKAPPTSTKD